MAHSEGLSMHKIPYNNAESQQRQYIGNPGGPPEDLLGKPYGCDIKSISALMGHSSVLTTEKVYAAVLPETLQRTVEKSLKFKI